MDRVSPAWRVVGVVAATRAEVVVGEVADRVQDDVGEEHERERQRLESAVGCREESRQECRLERDDEDDAPRRIVKSRDRVEGGEVLRERRIEAGEGARPLAWS